MGEMTIPADIVPNTEQDVVLDTKELSQNFDALSSQDNKNPIPLSMLAYIFSRVMRSSERSDKMKEVKTQLISLLQKDDADFEMLRRREEGLIDKITEAEIDRHFRHYLDKIEETDILNLITALKENDYIDKISFDLLDDDKLKNFKLSQLDNQSAINRLMSVVERGEDVSSEDEPEDEPEDEDDDFERSGKLMSAIDSSKPILYPMITQYIKEKGEGFEIDTKEYMNEVFEKEGFGSIDSEDFPFKTGLLGGKFKQQKGEEQGEEKGIPLLHLKLVGKKGVGRYEKGEDKFLLETFEGSKKFDTLEDAYDGIEDFMKKTLSSKNFLDKIILKQDKHPLKNILLKYLTAERRELRLGNISVDIETDFVKEKEKWVASMEKKFNLAGGIDVKLTRKDRTIAKNIFQIMSKFENFDGELLQSLVDNEVQGQKDASDIILDYYGVSEAKDAAEDTQNEIEDNNNNWSEIETPYKLLKENDEVPVNLMDILDEYKALQTKNEFDFENVMLYVKDFASGGKGKAGYVQGASRIPIITADVTFNMSTLLDTRPKNYQMFIRKPRAARNVSRGKKQREGRFKELRQKEERFKNPKLRAKYLGPFNLSDEKIDAYFEGRYEPLSDEEREEFENLTEELKREEEKETEQPFDIVKIQKDFLNVKRAYNSLKAIVGGN